MSDLPDFVRDALEDHAQRYYLGDHTHLFRAVITCHQCKVPPPDWVRDEMQAALHRFDTGEAKDIADAFDVHRPPRTRLPNLQARMRPDEFGVPLITRVCEAVDKAARDRPIDAQLFADVAAEFPGLSGATVRNWYYEVRSLLKRET